MDGDHLRERERDSGRLDSLVLYERLRPKGGEQFVTDAVLTKTAHKFVDNIRDVAKQASTLHGWRVQNLFRGVVVSLDKVCLIKEEDTGRYFFKGLEIKSPDFRVVTDDGAPLLVEVKNRAPGNPRADFTMPMKELNSLRRYCDLVGDSKLKIAIYWAGWNQWTLVDPVWFTAEGTKLRLPVLEAMARNEMAVLGDRFFGTEMPLALQIHCDPRVPQSGTASGSSPFTVGRVEFLVANRTIARPEEQRIAYTLMMFGGWSDITTILDQDGDQVKSVTFEFRPEEVDPTQRFQMHSPLSSLFSSYFAQATLDAQNSVRDIDAEYEPGGFGALVGEPYDGDVLRLWRFVVGPDSTSDSH